MKNLMQKLTSILLLSLLIGLQTPIVFAENTPSASETTSRQEFKCEDLNNQNASAPKSTPGQANDSNGGTKNPTKITTSLNDQLAVITEEPLGTADKKITFRCDRQIVCNGIEAPVDRPSNRPKKEGDSADLELIKKRSCKTTYVSSNICQPTNKSEITRIQSTAEINLEDSYTLCEPVMIYISPAGTSLLYYYIGQIYRYMATLGGSIAVLVLIIAGVIRASSGDSTDRISKANAIITKCISGLALLFLSAIILYAINPNFFIN